MPNFITIKDLISSFGEPYIASNDGDSFLEKVGIDDFNIRNRDRSISINLILLIDEELGFSIPGADGLGIFLALREGGITAISVEASFSDEAVSLNISRLDVTFRFPPALLKRVERVENRFVVPESPLPYEILLAGIAFRYSTIGTIDFRTETGPLTLSLPPAMIGDTGLVLEAEGLQLFLAGDETPPPGRPAGFKGLYVDTARLYLPEDFVLGDLIISLNHAGVGNGGVFGTLAATWVNTLREEEPYTDGPATGELFGLPFALKEFSLTLEQNIPIAASLQSELLLPHFRKKLEVTLGLSANGDITLDLRGTGNQNQLVELEIENLLNFRVNSAQINRIAERDIVEFALSGKIQPLLGGFDWPEFEIQRLAINTNGDVDIDGGWIDIPETFTLDFHGFKIDISQFGLGSEGEGDNERQWIGLSGGITLVEGIPLSASVEGLKFSWKTKGEPDLQVSLTGIAVHLEIPGTLVLDGMVSYQEIGPEDDLAKRTGISGHIFTGSVTIDLQALRTEVNAELLIGEIKDATGRSFTAFYIVLSAELPTAIPLGATGTGIYALQGLFGLHVAPDRRLTDGNPEAWYTWYKEDRGNDSDYSVTKVVKWAPRFDNYAFGAGLTLGTQFDDGFSINVGALVVVLIPGPVIMIEGRANFLKPRSGNGKQAQGALYALAVFDGLAATFQLNIDVQYDLEDVVAIQGGMECFFDFNDASRWYINLGRKDPESKRIQVSLLAILRASFYLMLSNSGIQTGAMVGFDFRASYGPVELKLIARIVVEAAIFWSPLQFEGKLELYGELSLKIFGIGIGLIIQALLEGKSPKPFWLHGLFRIALSLPFPLPSFDFQVELTLADDPTPPEPVFPFLTGVAMSHHKLAGKAWELAPLETFAPTPEQENQFLVVPTDSRPILSFARPVSGWSQTLVEGALVPVESDRVDNWEFRYALTNLVLYQKTATGGYDQKIKEYALNDLDEGVTFFELDQILPTPDAQQPKLQFWRQSPLDIMPRRLRESFLDDYPACEKTINAKTYDVFWAYIADGTQYPPEFIHQDLKFIVDLPALPTVSVPLLTGPQVQRASLLTAKLTVHLPQVTSRLQIFILDPRQVDENTRLQFGLGGGRVPPELAIQCTAYRAGRKFERNFPLVPSPNPALLQVTIDAEIDTFRLVPNNYDKLFIYLIQYKTLEEVTREQMTTPNPEAANERANQLGQLTLSPNSFYRLEIQTQIERRRVGEREYPIPPERSLTYSSYFRTGNGPGAQPKASANDPVTGQPLDYTTSPVNELSTYVSRTLPINGAKSFYYGYDIALEFNEPYVEAMYQSPLKMQVRDRNQKSQGALEGSWFSTLLPLFSSGLLTWLAAKQTGRCLPSEASPAPKVPSLRRSLPGTLKPQRLYNIDVVLESDLNNSLYSFQFATSRYKNIQEHLQSGLKEGESEIVRSLGSTTSPDLSWMETHRINLEAFRRERQALQALNLDDIRNLPQISEQLTKTYAALDNLQQTSANQFTRFYEALGLTFRPLPPHLEFSEIQIGSSNNRFLLLESPEPIEWSRVVVTCRAGDAEIPTQILWNDDQARAFLLQQRVGWLTMGEYFFEFQYSNGRDCPDLPVITVDTETLSSYAETLKVRLN